MYLSLLFVVLCWLAGSISVSASPFTDLSSSSPEARKKAAEIIQQNHLYTPSPREPWDKFVASISQGDAEDDVLNQLAKVSADHLPLKSDDLPTRGILTFPLDESWAIECVFDESKIIRCELVEHPKEVVVPPPSAFSGCWRTYRIDGSPVLHWYDLGKTVSAPGDYGESNPRTPSNPHLPLP